MTPTDLQAAEPPQTTWARLWRDRSARLGLLLFAALVAFAVFGPLLLPYDPLASDFSMRRDALGAPPGPSFAHPLGTDSLFRDILTRLASGARLSLGVAALATAVAVALGTFVGVAAGLAEGTRVWFVDVVLMRLIDALLALPFLLFVTAVGAAVGRPDAGTMLLVLGLTGWTGTARIVRNKTLEIRSREFVTASRALGGTALHVVQKHILPNLWGTLLVVSTTSIGHMILAEAVLSYLTLGTQPPAPSWGRMLHEAEPMITTQVVKVAAPGFAILLTVLATGRIAEGLRDVFEPRKGAKRASSVPFDLVLAAAVLLLVGVVRPQQIAGPIGIESESAAPVRGGTLRLATFVNVRTLDPALTYDEASRPIENLIYARLLTWNDRGEIAPDLAEKYNNSSDGLVYTFALRPGLKFHDGANVTSADVVRSIERTLRPKTPSPGASHYRMLRGFAAFHGGKAEHLEGVRAVDERTVVFELSEPDATFAALLTLSFAAPVCPSMGAAVDTQAPASPCGAGPFRLASFEPEASIKLSRFEGYYVPGRPFLDAIEWTIAMPPQTQRYRFEEGSLDLLRELSATDSARFESDSRWKHLFSWNATKTTNAIFLNTETSPFDSVHVRRAVALAVDPSVLSLVRPDVAETDRVLPPGVPGPARDRRMRTHNLEAALEEMARAGFAFDPKTGRGGYPHPIDYVTVPDSFEQQAAEVYAEQLGKIGLRVRLKLMPFASYLAEVSRRKTAAMGWTGWTADYPDPSNFFEPTLSSRAIEEDGSQNLAFFSNAAFDTLLTDARKTIDRDARMKLYERAEEIVRDEAPWIPTTVTRTPTVRQPYVRGFVPHPILPPQLAEVWLDPAVRTVARRALSTQWMFGAVLRPDSQSASGRSHPQGAP
ncbi:MAG: ABC transporter permease subunit [Polyangiaceae bacterium]|nr:ABC transporter permease subunit [Polyangiaceae bacterium]